MAVEMQHTVTGNDDYISRLTNQISWVQQYSTLIYFGSTSLVLFICTTLTLGTEHGSKKDSPCLRELTV